MAVATQMCGRCGSLNPADAIQCVHCNQPLPRGSASQVGHAAPIATPPPPPAPAPTSATPGHGTGLLAPNHVLHGRYRILGTAGQGGMGAVYRAADTRAGGKPVAIKELSQTGLDPEELEVAVATFRHEAALLARLKHASLPKIFGDFAEGGRWYLAMQYIDGQTLEQLVQRNGGKPLRVDQVLMIGEALCSVLTYLHSQRPPIIFRDLKPSNVMLTSDQHLFLIDFGIARIFKPGQKHDTMSFGSPGFAAPEQYGRSQTTVRSDIYSLGATLHQLLTGIDPSVRPFEFVSIRQRNTQVPAELDRLINNMVQMNESRRPESTAVVGRELRAISARLHASTMQRWAPAPAPSAPPTLQPNVASRAVPAVKPRRARPSKPKIPVWPWVGAAQGAPARPAVVKMSPAPSVRVAHVPTPPPPAGEMRRNKRTVLFLSLISIALLVVTGVEWVRGTAAFLDVSQTSSHFLGPWGLGILALVAAICMWFVAWVISMVRTALVARWGWFMAMLILGIALGPFAILWYGLFGPLERRA